MLLLFNEKYAWTNFLECSKDNLFLRELWTCPNSRPFPFPLTRTRICLYISLFLYYFRHSRRPTFRHHSELKFGTQVHVAWQLNLSKCEPKISMENPENRKKIIWKFGTNLISDKSVSGKMQSFPKFPKKLSGIFRLFWKFFR